jgi:2',3'-cyclic-nucleotide 2'-phosphodiesterase (5'-nucleotidase family)
VVLVDAGDALSRIASLPPDKAAAERERQKASLILSQMGRLDYAGMAVGERDLVLGVAQLKKAAKEAKLPLLAANLTDKDGGKPFAPRRVVPAGDGKVGVFALVGPAPEYSTAGLSVSAPAEQAAVQVDALRREGAGFIVTLLHMGYDAALTLSKELKGVDLVIQSHDGRVSTLQPVGSTLLVGGGERGRLVGKATFNLAGERPYADLSDAGATREQMAQLDANIEQVKERIKAEPSMASQYDAMLKNFRQRREELVSRLSAKPPSGRRTVLTEMVAMDEKVPDEGFAKKAVDGYIAKHGSTVVQH